MKTKHFIFDPGTWIGEGDISFSTSEQKIHFYTKWTIKALEDEGILCEQQVERQDGCDRFFNKFLFSNISEKDFVVEITNDNVTKGNGVGVFNEHNIGWDFPAQSGIDDEYHFEGYEIYHLKSDSTYEIHGEYFSGNSFKTIIKGKLWKKS